MTLYYYYSLFSFDALCTVPTQCRHRTLNLLFAYKYCHNKLFSSSFFFSFFCLNHLCDMPIRCIAPLFLFVFHFFHVHSLCSFSFFPFWPLVYQCIHCTAAAIKPEKFTGTDGWLLLLFPLFQNVNLKTNHQLKLKIKASACQQQQTASQTKSTTIPLKSTI